MFHLAEIFKINPLFLKMLIFFISQYYRTALIFNRCYDIKNPKEPPL